MAEYSERAWYRTYRPMNMDTYIGDRIKRTVEQRFTNEKDKPNVILIHGTRGCGKTTFARIISKYYQCESPINGKPCEHCLTCETINSTLFNGEAGVECPGVLEVDATTANGKEAIQNIMNDAIEPPIDTKYKILILDECHMITTQAQNSILKVIEDIPPHLVVIFATTDVDKVLSTVISRCQVRLEVTKPSIDEMANRLLEICKAENVTTSMEALRLIAKQGGRVPRECINLLENVAKTYNKEVTLNNVVEAVDATSSDLYIDFFKAANTSLLEILKFNKTLEKKDIDITKFLSGLMRFSLDSMYIKHGLGIEGYSPDYVKRVRELYSMYKSADFDMLLQVLERASNTLSNDAAKNEVILTTTALRIGKINLLASGLAGEQNSAYQENKESLLTYSKTFGSSHADIAEFKKEITTDYLNESFRGLKEVQGAREKLLEGFPGDTQDDTVQDTSAGFISQDEILKLMNED